MREMVASDRPSTLARTLFGRPRRSAARSTALVITSASAGAGAVRLCTDLDLLLPFSKDRAAFFLRKERIAGDPFPIAEHRVTSDERRVGQERGSTFRYRG